MSGLPDECSGHVRQLTKLAFDLDAATQRFQPQRNDQDLRDVAAMVQTVRAVSFMFAFCEAFVAGRPSPASTLSRSIFEASLLLRWVLTSPEHAHRWFEVGKREGQAVLRALHRRDLSSFEGDAREDDLRDIVDGETIRANVPSVHRMAREVGMDAHYDVCYRRLSAEAHGSWFTYYPDGSGYVLTHTGEYRGARGRLVPGVNMSNDIYRVFRSWSENRTVPKPLPVA